MIIKKENAARFLAITFITCFVLTPTIKIPGLLGIRLDDLIAFLLMLSYLSAPFFFKVHLKFPTRGFLILAFSIVMLTSITSGALQGLPTNIMDLTKYIWLIKLFVIYIFFFNYIHSEPSVEQPKRIFLLDVIVNVALISSIVCFTQYVNLMGLNAYYIPIIAPTQATTLLDGYATPRVVGIIGNPNAQGYILALAFLCLLFKNLLNYSKTNLLTGLIIFAALLMTLSRTSLLITLIGSLSLLLLYKKNKSFLYLKFFIIVLLSLLFSMLFIFLQQNEFLYNLILWRFEALGSVMEDKSFVSRFHGWGINIKFFLDNPVIGVGPIPRGTQLFGTADNEWLYFARSYGVTGLTWLLLFFFIPFLVSKSRSREDKNMRSFILTILFMTMVYMVPAGVFTSSSLNGLLIIILAFYDKNICYVRNNGFSISSK